MLSSGLPVHQKLLVSKYTAIIQLIYGQLNRIVSIYARAVENKCIEKKDIPLSKGKSDIKISYISAIALQLSKSHNSQPFSIANSIVSHLSADLGEDLHLQVLPSGLIYIEVSDLILAAWLQSFIDNQRGEIISTNHFSEAIASDFGDLVFSIQYVHARCCSLLRLAQQEKLIDSRKFSSQSIPWLNSKGQFRLNHQAERRLISSLVKVVDELEPVITRPLKWQGAAFNLVQAFESFWSSCRIYGDLKITTPELVMARIGLVITTQRILQFLLEEKLDVPACLEL